MSFEPHGEQYVPPQSLDYATFGPPPAGTSSTMHQPNGWSLASLIIGLVALPAVLTVVFGLLLGLIAVALGFIGVAQARRLGAGRGQAIGGIVTGGFALLLSVGLIVAGGALLNALRTAVNNGTFVIESTERTFVPGER